MKRAISLLLVCCLAVVMIPLYSFAAGTTTFSDVPSNAWYAGSVQYVYDNGLMVGTSDTRFGPGTTTTRGMIVTIIHRMEDTPASSGSTFSDVPADKWFSNAVTWASVNNIVSGYGNGRFGPDDTITREQMASILFRYASFKGYEVSDIGNLTQFKDSRQISEWARTALSWANGTGLISGKGDGVLDPKGSATRAEVASILMRFSKKFAASYADIETIEAYGEYSENINSIVNSYLDADGYVLSGKENNALDAVAKYAETLFNERKITDYSYHPENGDSCVYMQIDGWLGFVYMPRIKDTLSGGNDGINLMTFEPYESTFQFGFIDTIADIFTKVKNLGDLGNAMQDMVSGMSYSHVYKNDEVTLDALQNIKPNSIVIWNGHGGYNSETGSILGLDSHKWNQADILLYQMELGDGAAFLTTGGDFCVTAKYFNDYMPSNSFSNCLIYLNACYSFDLTDPDLRLANSFWDNGARAVLGNSSEVNSLYSTEMMYAFFARLCAKNANGNFYTVDEALNFAKDTYGAYDPLGEHASQVLMARKDDFTLKDMINTAKENSNEVWKTHKYEIFSGVASTWDEAKAYCQARGGHLATITSQGENDYVYQLVRDAGHTNAYFGLSDREVEGTWVWVTGEPLSYTNWHSGEPNSETANEDYAMFYYKYSDGKWNDGTFGGRNPEFICEWDSEAAYSKYLKDFQSPADDSYSKQANAMKEAYIAVLDSFPKTTEHTYTISGKNTSYYEDTRYGLYDIDKNKIPELFIQVDKSKFYVYTYQNNQAVLCTIDSMDNARWSYDSPLYKYNGNGLLVHDGGSGNLHIEYISLYVLSGNKLKLSTNILDTAQGSNYQEIRDYLSKSAALSPQMSSINVDDWQARIALQIVSADW